MARNSWGRKELNGLIRFNGLGESWGSWGESLREPQGGESLGGFGGETTHVWTWGS